MKLYFLKNFSASKMIPLGKEVWCKISIRIIDILMLLGITKRINRNNGVWIDVKIKREFEKFEYVGWRRVAKLWWWEGEIAIYIYILYKDREYQMKITRRNFLMSGQSKIFIFDEHISVAHVS